MNNQQALALFSSVDFPMVTAQYHDWLESQPLRGVRLLHNIPLTLETVYKLQPLLAAGADVTVTHAELEGLEPNPKAELLVRELGLVYEPDHQAIQGEFDVVLDCCAQVPDMPNIKVTKGIVELTQTGTLRYRDNHYGVAVVSVDDSPVKGFETLYGTGVGFVQGYELLTGELLAGKHLVLFGYGKVGRGIARAANNVGALISVVEPVEAKQADAKHHGFHVVEFTAAAVQSAMAAADVVVTATGVAGVVSTMAGPAHCEQAVLANMGAEDEFGERFPAERVLANKCAINFLLERPTPTHYLDPIFYSHNLAALEIMQGEYALGYHPWPVAKSQAVIDNWLTMHPDRVAEIDVDELMRSS